MMSSKATKSGKDNSELKKELSDFATRLATLTSRFEQVGTLMNQSQEAVASDKELKGQISSLKQRVAELEETDCKNTESFALSMLRVSEQYRIGLNKAQATHDVELQKVQKEHNESAQRTRQQMTAEQAQIRKLRTRETTERAEANAKIDGLKKEWASKEAKLEQQLEQLRKQVSDAAKQEKSLAEDLLEQKIILRGRETEKEQLIKRLKDIENFQDLPLDRMRTEIADIEQELQEFCVHCVNNADLHPSWNQVPDVLRKTGLSLNYDRQTDEGAAFITNVIRDSVVNVMRKLVFTDAVVCACAQSQRLSEALYRQSPSRHAIWRSTVVRAISEHPILQDGLRYGTEEMANDLVHSWKLFAGKVEQEMQGRLSRLLDKSQMFWLRLQNLPTRILVDYRAGNVLADSRSEISTAARMPGEFGPDDIAEPVLCLFPSFWSIPVEKGVQPVLIHEGKTMYKTSPDLLAILEISRKKRTSSQVDSKGKLVVQKMMARAG